MCVSVCPILFVCAQWTPGRDRPPQPLWGGNLQYKNMLFTGTSAIVPGEKDQSFPPSPQHTLKLRLGLMGGMEISASVPMNAIISFLYRKCSRDLWEGVGAISSLCWINAVILYQESLGITLNRAGFMQNGFKPSFFLNDGPNLLAHFKLLISFIFK